MTNNDTAWYEAMAKAMKNREKCLSAIERWMDALREAESAIAELAAQRQAPIGDRRGPEVSLDVPAEEPDVY